jgi:hypothetical protein
MWKEKSRGYDSCTNGFFGKITQSHHILKHFFFKLVDLVKNPLMDDCQLTYLTKQKNKETKSKAKPNLSSTHMPFTQCLYNRHLIQFTCKATKIFFFHQFCDFESLAIFSKFLNFFFFFRFTLWKTHFFPENFVTKMQNISQKIHSLQHTCVPF